MGRNGVHLVREWPDEPQVRATLCAPRSDLVLERAVKGDQSRGRVATFTQSHGPFVRYRRTVVAHGDGLREETGYELIIPWFR